MGTAVKEKKKKARKPNTPFTFEVEKKIFNKVIKAQTDYIGWWDIHNLLSGILMTVKDGELTLVSTDGNRMLKTEMEMLDKSQTFEPVVYNGRYLANMKISKGLGCPKDCPDSLEITLSDKEMTILDMFNKITYIIPALEGQYPNYEHLLKFPENAHSIALNVNYLKDLKNLHVNERTDIVHLTVNKEDSLQPIYAETENGEGIKTTTLLMPIQVRK